MAKLVFCCRRNPNLSVEEFQRSWLDDHVLGHCGLNHPGQWERAGKDPTGSLGLTVRKLS